MHPHHDISLIGTVTVGPKGQVVIPAEVRTSLNIKPGDKLVALSIRGKQAVAFVPEDCLQDLIDKMGKHVEALRAIVDESTDNK